MSAPTTLTLSPRPRNLRKGNLVMVRDKQSKKAGYLMRVLRVRKETVIVVPISAARAPRP